MTYPKVRNYSKYKIKVFSQEFVSNKVKINNISFPLKKS